VSYQSTSH
jgi:2-polyprenyl-3-methyl-5-hydroxy-6-metoxy-1,4-benzoquinol methylase